MAILNERMKSFVESSVSNDFGLTVDQVANQCKNYGRFSAWLSSDVSRIKSVLNNVKAKGVSPAFFAAYERTEGYNSSWGWLNHTRPQGGPMEDSSSVARWIVRQSNTTGSNPAWIDYANYKDFVPPSVKSSGNAHFQSLPKGTIGRVVIAGTAAATWEVYYPNGLKKEYNGVQNYAAPLNLMIDTILSWGGNLVGGGVSFEGTIVDYLLASDTGLSLTSKYGYRIHPITGEWKLHEGSDIAKSGSPSPQTPVPARAEIIHAGPSGTGLGNWVVYRLQGSQYMIGIGHFDSVSVSKGDIIEAGTSVGIMGSSGNVTGRHWHIEVRDYSPDNYFRQKTYNPENTIFYIEGDSPSSEIISTSSALISMFLTGTLKVWNVE